jgi:hypothetical protein
LLPSPSKKLPFWPASNVALLPKMVIILPLCVGETDRQAGRQAKCASRQARLSLVDSAQHLQIREP